MKIKTLWRVINCDEHENRIAQFREKAANAGLPHVARVKCTDGKKLTNRNLCGMISDGLLNSNADLVPTEVAISLSHVKCWMQLLKSDAEHMVVFEDDCKVYKDFMKKFDAVMNAGLFFDVMWLYNGNWGMTKHAHTKVASVEKVSIYRENVAYVASASCYVLTRKWAQCLVDKVFPIKYPIDVFMGQVKVKTAKHYTVSNRRRKNASFDCFTISPFLYCPCPSYSNSTQQHSAKTVKARKKLLTSAC